MGASLLWVLECVDLSSGCLSRLADIIRTRLA